MSATSIEWTDVTWNPVRGCSRVSEGCRNCYAERLAARFPWGEPYARTTAAGPRWTGVVELVPGKLGEPLTWRKPRRVFVNSMSDLFHEALSFESITAVYGVMAAAPEHTFQVLTKRPQRRREWAEWLRERGGLGPCIRNEKVGAREQLRPFFDAVLKTTKVRGRVVRHAADPWCMVFNAAGCIGVGPLINVWEGVSVEDQATADERIPILLQTPASVRFVSYEPALGPIDFGPWVNPLASVRTLEPGVRWLDWVIVGGESGPGARSFDVEWARSAVRQCREARTACFVKQLGAKPITDHRTRPEGEPHYWTYNLGAKASDPSMWPEDLRIREFPQ